MYLYSLYEEKINWDEEIIIELDYRGETTADFSEIYEGYGAKIKDDFTWYYQARNYGEFKSLQNRFKIPDVEFNFSENYMLVSLGRKLEKLVYYETYMREEERSYPTYPTFVTDSYNQDTAYIYAIKKIRLTDMEVYGDTFIEQNYIR